MLEHLRTDDEVESLTSKRQARRVAPHVRSGEQVGGDVATVREQVGIWSLAAAQVESTVGGRKTPGDALDLAAQAPSAGIHGSRESAESDE
jgi:hypothetical protein